MQHTQPIKLPMRGWTIGAVSTGAASTGVVLTLPALAGFGAEGVAAGSVAAAWQSSIGSIAAGSNFALLQTFGATVPTAPALGAGLVVAGVGGLGYLGLRRYRQASTDRSGYPIRAPVLKDV